MLNSSNMPNKSTKITATVSTKLHISAYWHTKNDHFGSKIDNIHSWDDNRRRFLFNFVNLFVVWWSYQYEACSDDRFNNRSQQFCMRSIWLQVRLHWHHRCDLILPSYRRRVPAKKIGFPKMRPLHGTASRLPFGNGRSVADVAHIFPRSNQSVNTFLTSDLRLILLLCVQFFHYFAQSIVVTFVSKKSENVIDKFCSAIARWQMAAYCILPTYIAK